MGRYKFIKQSPVGAPLNMVLTNSCNIPFLLEARVEVTASISSSKATILPYQYRSCWFYKTILYNRALVKTMGGYPSCPRRVPPSPKCCGFLLIPIQYGYYLNIIKLLLALILNQYILMEYTATYNGYNILVSLWSQPKIRRITG